MPAGGGHLNPVVLSTGELFTHERFGPGTVNRGAVLYECDWDGGVFESGVMLGGIFRSGVFRGGIFWAGFWRGGVWEGGLWHNGFDPDGTYRPRGTPPGTPRAAPPALAEPERADGRLLTVFTSSVYPDLVRLWRACLSRALPASDVAVEVFDDSADGRLSDDLPPDTALLRRSAARPDFQEAYNDALARCATPFLAFVDTDVFWISPEVFGRVMKELDRPEVAAVSCVSRTSTESHGTFAVVMRVSAYREALRSVPGGFVQRATGEAAGGAPGRWVGHDTGDLATDAVRRAGHTVKFLQMEKRGGFARFDGITNTRLIAGWVGEGPLLQLAVSNPYFRRGCLGNLALGAIHDRLFPAGPPYETPVPASKLWRTLWPHPRTALRAAVETARFLSNARTIGRFISGR